MLETWPQAFALTQAVEVPVYALLLTGPWPVRGLRAVAPSSITHPLLWFGLPPLVATLPVCADAFVFGGACWWAVVAVAEVGVVAAEGAIVWAMGAGSPRRSVAVALLANAASFGAGELLRRLAGQ